MTIFTVYTVLAYSGAEKPPPFVNDSYYCESANEIEEVVLSKLFSMDKLWDG